MNYQIGAVKKSEGAQKLFEGARKRGFRAFILEPAEGDPNPFFRVQVGPFTNAVEAEDVKKKLQGAGYDPRPILKK
jgi:cell division septation protein DedD